MNMKLIFQHLMKSGKTRLGRFIQGSRPIVAEFINYHKVSSIIEWDVNMASIIAVSLLNSVNSRLATQVNSIIVTELADEGVKKIWLPDMMIPQFKGLLRSLLAQFKGDANTTIQFVLALLEDVNFPSQAYKRLTNLCGDLKPKTRLMKCSVVSKIIGWDVNMAAIIAVSLINAVDKSSAVTANKILLEEVGEPGAKNMWLPDYLDAEYKSLFNTLISQLQGDLQLTIAFALDLLEDVNCPSKVYKKLTSFFNYNE